MALQQLEIEIDHVVENTRPLNTKYRILVRVGPGLTSRERTILLNTAKKCHVGKILSGNSHFSFAIDVNEPGARNH